MLVALASLALGVPEKAAAQTEIPAGWVLKPSGLNAGDKFRLLIVTSSQENPTSTNIATYNATVQTNVANNGHASIQSYSANFKALGCTATVSAITNTDTATTITDVSIYWLNGAKVADDYGDLYDGSWDSNVPKYPDGTNAVSSGIESTVAHGCTVAGTIHDTYFLGGASIQIGFPGNQGFELAINLQTSSTATDRRIYGLSEVFQVASANAAPTVANPIDDQTATVGTALDYTFPTNTFADTDTGDTLTYMATQSDDSALPRVG